MNDFCYYNLRARTASDRIDLLFPGWGERPECVLVLSPHDDDALLGAGYAMLAAAGEGADVHVCIYCDGSAGYSSPDERDGIVEVRRREALRAYGAVDLPPERVHRLELPDFGARAYLGRRLPGGEPGIMDRLVSLVRGLRVTRLLVPNGYREHVDHEATFDSGRYDGVQAGDPVLADLGEPTPVLSTLVYAVWGDLDPLDALASGGDPAIRANRAIVAGYGVEEAVARALGEWRSQARIIEGLLDARRERDCGEGMMELYVDTDPRPRLRYAPYARLIRSIRGR